MFSCMKENSTLQDVLPYEFREYTDTEAFKLSDVRVISMHEGFKQRWPGKHKNVHAWWTLENGRRVGWNENPAKGWSFPGI